MSQLGGLVLLTSLALSQPANAATIVVNSGGDLQGAINSASCGDTIVLQAGAVFTLPQGVNILLRNRGNCSDTQYITITTSNPSGIPASGSRVDPSLHAAAMPKIVGNAYAPVQTEPGANHYKLIGLEITTDGNAYTPDLVQIGGSGSNGGYPTREDMLALTKITVDRCFIHPAEINAGQLMTSSVYRSAGRGIHLVGTYLSVVNSWIGGFTGYYPGTTSSIDSYGVYADVGLGPITIDNNYIEANFNNVFIGGADPPTPNSATLLSGSATQATLTNVANLAVNDPIAFVQGGAWKAARVTAISGSTVSYVGFGPSGLAGPPDVPGQARWKGDLPHDIAITRNTLLKRADWVAQGLGQQAKAFAEIKDGENILIDGNRMITTYPTALALTNRNQQGSAVWSVIHNLTVSNNHVSGWGAAAVIVGSDNEKSSSIASQITFRNNLFDAPGPSSYNYLFATQNGQSFNFIHNTFINTNGNNILFGIEAMSSPSIMFRDNIMFYGAYGMSCFVAPNTVQTCWPGLSESNNVVVDNLGAGAGTNFPRSAVVSSIGSVGFTDAASGNYRLSASSPYRNRASDGTDIGVNMDALSAAMSGQSSNTAPTAPINVHIVE